MANISFLQLFKEIESLYLAISYLGGGEMGFGSSSGFNKKKMKKK